MKKIRFITETKTVCYGTDSIVLSPPLIKKVRAERYENLPLYDEKAAGWNSGRKLLGVQAHECTFADALVPGSVRVKVNGRMMKANVDFKVNERWGTVGRLPEGEILSGEQVAISYAYYPSRIDALLLKSDGSLGLKIGKIGMAHPEIPSVSAKDVRLANIFWHGDPAAFSEDNIYPVTETEFPADLLSATVKPAKALEKLYNGKNLRILAWGDSVTQCSYMPEKCRWQEQFCQKLRKKYPDVDIELLTEAWGGRDTSIYFSVPPGEEHNFEEKVLALKPDLIISEFVNDCDLDEDTFQANYQRLKTEFDRIGAEWIILTPHYIRPDRMKFENSKNCDEDPRPPVKFLREFSVQNNIPLADASRYWGRLYRQGIPYDVLFSNGINHPLEYGMSLYADALMKLF